MKRPTCEKKGMVPHPATKMLGWELDSGKTWTPLSPAPTRPSPSAPPPAPPFGGPRGPRRACCRRRLPFDRRAL